MAHSLDQFGLDLFEGERVIAPAPEAATYRRFSSRIDAETVIAATAGVDDIAKIGTNGAPFASRAFEASAGEGLYEAFFARDALVMISFGDDYQLLAKTTLVALAQLQGKVDRPGSDTEKRGQIPHEHREVGDPIREEYSNRFGWRWPYFGSIDATPLFVSAALRAERKWGGILSAPVGPNSTIRDAVSESLQWILRHLEVSPVGLVETEVASNGCWQVWEDSPDVYHHADGRLISGHLAPVEVQGFAYDALTDAADWLEREAGEDGSATFGALDLWHLRAAAARLQMNVISRFWVDSPNGGYLAAGLERNGDVTEAITVRNVNMGLVLDGRLLEGGQYETQRAAIIRELMLPSRGMCRPSGVTCIGPESPRFRDVGYHTGSIWPWTTYCLARGLDRHGYYGLGSVARALADHASEELNCFPEYVRGTNSPHPELNEAIVHMESPDGNGSTFSHRVMQPPQHFQGWTVYGYTWSQRTEAKIEAGQAFECAGGRARKLELEILEEMHQTPAFIAALGRRNMERLTQSA
jgi:glycogen debranching enzyme